MEFLEQLPTNFFVWFIVSAATIASVYLAYKSVPQKVLKFSLSHNNLISSGKASLPNLKIVYAGTNVDQVTVTKVIFWNSSFPTISEQDIIKAAPLSIIAKTGEILDVSVLNGEDTSNQIKVELIDEKTAYISFDYLDRKEGGVIQVVHTGDRDSIDVSRKIKGGKIVLKKKSALKSAIKEMAVYLFSIGAMLILDKVSIKLLPEMTKTKEIVTLQTGPSIVMGCLIMAVTILLFLIVKRGDKDFTPKNCIVDRKKTKKRRGLGKSEEDSP